MYRDMRKQQLEIFSQQTGVTLDPADPDGPYSPVGYRDFLRQQEGLLTQAPKMAPGGGPPDPGGDPPDSGKGSSDKKVPNS